MQLTAKPFEILLRRSLSTSECLRLEGTGGLVLSSSRRTGDVCWLESTGVLYDGSSISNGRRL